MATVADEERTGPPPRRVRRTGRPLGGLLLATSALTVVGIATVIALTPATPDDSIASSSGGMDCGSSGVSTIVSVEALHEINVFRCPTRSLRIRFPTGATASILEAGAVIGPENAGGSGTLIVSADEFYRWRIDTQGWVVAWRPGQGAWWSEWWGEQSAIDRVRAEVGE